MMPGTPTRTTKRILSLLGHCNLLSMVVAQVRCCRGVAAGPRWTGDPDFSSLHRPALTQALSLDYSSQIAINWKEVCVSNLHEII